MSSGVVAAAGPGPAPPGASRKARVPGGMPAPATGDPLYFFTTLTKPLETGVSVPFGPTLKTSTLVRKILGAFGTGPGEVVVLGG